MEKKEFLSKHEITEAQFSGKEKVDASWDFGNQASIPEGFNPNLTGSLILGHVKKLPKGFSPTVNRELDLRALELIPEGFNPKLGKDTDLHLGNLKELPEGFRLEIPGNLYLYKAKLPEGFNLKVGGDLRLDYQKSIPKGFNPKVGRNLDLSGLESIPEGFNPEVKGDLLLNSIKTLPEWFNPKVGGVIWLKKGKYKKQLKATVDKTGQVKEPSTDKEVAKKLDFVYYPGFKKAYVAAKTKDEYNIAILNAIIKEENETPERDYYVETVKKGESELEDLLIDQGWDEERIESYIEEIRNYVKAVWNLPHKKENGGSIEGSKEFNYEIGGL